MGEEAGTQPGGKGGSILKPGYIVERFQDGFATPGMIDAYNAGLSTRRVRKLWDICSNGAMYDRLKKSGVQMREGNYGPPPETIIKRYRDIAAEELTIICEKPADKSLICATQGMINAYTVGFLSTRGVACLWRLSRGEVHRRLKNAGVITRSNTASRTVRPTSYAVLHYQSVAARELAAAREKNAAQMTPGPISKKLAEIECGTAGEEAAAWAEAHEVHIDPDWLGS